MGICTWENGEVYESDVPNLTISSRAKAHAAGPKKRAMKAMRKAAMAKKKIKAMKKPAGAKAAEEKVEDAEDEEEGEEEEDGEKDEETEAEEEDKVEQLITETDPHDYLVQKQAGDLAP